MTGVGKDLIFALRQLSHQRGLAAVVVATLALGIGVNTALFSVVRGVLLRPLPYDQPERLVLIRTGNPAQGWDGNPLPPAAFDGLAEKLPSIGAVAAYSEDSVPLVGGEEPHQISVGRVSPEFLEVVGVTPVAGRDLDADDDRADAPPVLLLSEGLWKRQFGGDRSMVGRDVRLGGVTHTVVGIVPGTVQWPGVDTAAWLPLKRASLERPWGNWSVRGIGRMTAGASPERVGAELEAFWAGLDPEHSNWEDGWRLSATPLMDEITGEVRQALWVLFAAVGLVLLIACVNVANLLLSRAHARRRELAVRAALGAGRSRLVRQILTENLVLALFGGAAGLLLAHWSLPLLLTMLPEGFPRIDGVQIDLAVYGFALAASVATGVVSGALPAWQAIRLELTDGLSHGERLAEAHSTTRAVLVVGEVALAVMLFVGAGLMARSFVRALEVSPGFRAEEVVTAKISLPGTRHAEPPQWRTFFHAVKERLEAMPGVRAVGATTGVPTRSVRFIGGIELEGRDGIPDVDLAGDIVTPGYFRALSVPVLRGRAFDATDRDGAPPTVVINRSLARRFWPGADPIGRRIRMHSSQEWHTIIGVVGDVKQYGLESSTPLQAYFAYDQRPVGTLTWMVRAEGDPASRLEMVKAAVWTVDPTQPLTDLRTMPQVVARSTAQREFNTLLLASFAAIALALAGIGIFGVISYAVGRRTREIGTRIVLGARGSQILRMVLGHGMKLAALGLGIGIAAALGLSRFLAGMLYEVNPADGVTFLLTTAAVLPLAALACWVPAHRATRIDPMEALRAD